MTKAPIYHYHFKVMAGTAIPGTTGGFANVTTIEVVARDETQALKKAQEVAPARPSYLVTEIRECFDPHLPEDIELWRNHMKGPQQPWDET